MPEWLIERGIGETRAALVEDGEIVEARILLDGVVPAGTVLDGAAAHDRRAAVAIAGRRSEYLLPKRRAGRHRGRDA